MKSTQFAQSLISAAFQVAQHLYEVRVASREAESRLEKAEENLRLAEDSAAWAEGRFFQALEQGFEIPSRMVSLAYWRGRVEAYRAEVRYLAERLDDCWAQSAQVGRQFWLSRRQVEVELTSVPSFLGGVIRELEYWADPDGQWEEEGIDGPFEGYWYEMELRYAETNSFSHMGKGVIKCSPPFSNPKKGQKRPSKPKGKRMADRRPRPRQTQPQPQI